MPKRSESILSKLVRGSKTFAAQVRRETAIVDEAWEAAYDSAQASKGEPDMSPPRRTPANLPG
jgi:hypothetical protein